MSLEDIFLHLTTDGRRGAGARSPPRRTTRVTALRNISAIVEKEWRHYFGSPIAYVALFVWTMLFGIFFYFVVQLLPRAVDAHRAAGDGVRRAG